MDVVHEETEFQRVPQVVIERPAVAWGHVVLWTLIGLVAGLLAGFVLKLVQDVGEGGTEPIDPAWLLAPASSYVPVVTLLFVLTGFVYGWAKGRTSEPRIEMVELPMTLKERLRRRRRQAALTITTTRSEPDGWDRGRDQRGGGSW